MVGGEILFKQFNEFIEDIITNTSILDDENNIDIDN